MRKVFVLLLCIVSLASLGQPIVSRAGSANTVSDARLQAAVNFFLPRYADTSFAASSLGVDSTGALIYTYVPNAIWVRKANPKKWVRITDANTNPYSAGYGLNLISNVFSVDSTVIATRGRLYKVVDSLIAARTPGLPSVLNVDNDADGKSIYNLSSLFTLDTLKTSGPFQLGNGVYATSFPRTLTANRTMVVPDQSDTLAGRIWTRNLVSSISPTAPGLGPVLSVSGDAGGQDITNVGSVSANTNIYSPVFNTNEGDGHGYNISDLSMALITPGGGGVDDRQLRFMDDHYGGGVQKRVWLQVNKAANGDTYIPFSVNGQFADDNGNITVSSTTPGLDSVIGVSGDAGNQEIYNASSIGANQTLSVGATGLDGYLQIIGSLGTNGVLIKATNTTTSRELQAPDASGTIALQEWVTAQGYSTGGYTAGNGLLLTSTTFSADTVLLATRGRLYKTIDSMKTVNAAVYQTSASAATTYFPLAGGSVTGTGGAGFIGLIPQTSAPSTPASGVRLYASSTGAMTWKGTNGFQRTFSGSGITADRTYTLPDATGTLALTSDLSSYLTTATAAATYQTLAARVTKGVLVSWANSATVAANGTAYYGPGISGQTMGSTESARQTVSSVSGVIRSLYVKTLLTQSALDQMTVSVRVNGVTSGVTITIPAGAVAGTFSDTTHSIAVSAGDLISFILINSAAATSAGIASISIEITNN